MLVLLHRPAFGFFFPAIYSAEVAWAVAVVRTARHGELQCVAVSAAEGLRGSELPCLLTT